MYTMYFITVLFAVLIPLIFPFFFWNELSWKLIKNVYLNRGPNKLMLQCPSLLHQMYMLFINWMYFICDNKLCWTCWTWTWTWMVLWFFFAVLITDGAPLGASMLVSLSWGHVTWWPFYFHGTLSFLTSHCNWFENQVLINFICWCLGAVSIRKTVLPGMAIPMLKIRRPNGRLIFNMEIAIRR